MIEIDLSKEVDPFDTHLWADIYVQALEKYNKILEENRKRREESYEYR